jgi:SAM-dependent methyltransferase
MSFWPLPTSLIEALRAASKRGAVVELGAGEGRFARRLEQLGLQPVLVDRSRFAPAGRLRVCAELSALPLRTEVSGLLVLANTLRHVAAPDCAPSIRETWRALAPGGSLLILEDDPRARDGAEMNYRSALRLLARVDRSRGVTVEADRARRSVAPICGDPRAAGRVSNQEEVEDPAMPLRWLRAQAPWLTGEIDDLEAAVQRDGMAYGAYWFQVYQKESR